MPPARAGYARVRVDGNMYDLSEEINLEKNIKHTIEIVVDRLVVNDTDPRKRLADSIETALAQADGLVVIDVIGGEPDDVQPELRLPRARHLHRRTDARGCSRFNNPVRRLSGVSRSGHRHEDRPGGLVIPDKRSPSGEGAIKASGWASTTTGTISEMYFKALAKHYGFTLDTPVKDFRKEALHALLYGTKVTSVLRCSRESMFGSGTYFNQFEGIITESGAPLSARRAASGSGGNRQPVMSSRRSSVPPAMGRPA